ncbi:hypothetical protein Hte_008884 [Hypoxylon texense]
MSTPATMSDKTSTNEQPRFLGISSLISGVIGIFKKPKEDPPFWIVKEPSKSVTEQERFVLKLGTEATCDPRDYVRIDLEKADRPAAKNTTWKSVDIPRENRIAHWEDHQIAENHKIAAFELSLSGPGAFRIKIEVKEYDEAWKDDLTLATLYTNRFATPGIEIP